VAHHSQVAWDITWQTTGSHHITYDSSTKLSHGRPFCYILSVNFAHRISVSPQ